MSIFLGIDIGTVSVKIAILGDEYSQDTLLRAAEFGGVFFQPTNQEKIQKRISSGLLVSNYMRIRGNPVIGTYHLLKRILRHLPSDEIEGIRVCGSGGKLIAGLLGLSNENEFRALATGVGRIYPHVSTIFEMGGQNSKYISLEREAATGTVGIADYEKGGDCAAGTGSFLDQQASRLKFNINSIGDIVSKTNRSAKIAGRCSVFAKSDMIHAQQRGYTPAEILKGLCEAVARNFKSSIVKSKKIKKPTIFIGGVAINAGVVNAMREVFKLHENELTVPEYYAWMPAIGTALAEREASVKSGLPNLEILHDASGNHSANNTFSNPLSMKNVVLLRDKVSNKISDNGGKRINAYMGIDVGSVSTNVAVIDSDGKMLKEIYTKTDGRPIEIVDKCLKEIDLELGSKMEISGVGTTGSGRELIGELIGSDTINDEITAHKMGAEFLAQAMLDKQPDTIFEIGGQDSKFISIENGVVVDFSMNEACAAGTGSFLEERAEELNISIKEEFAKLAISAENPVRLGERCTVFMQQDVASYQQNGVDKANITAGLAYSVVYNYLNRVVGRRKIGKTIFFQGGTAYNDAIASAFAMVLQKQIIVPPYNGVVGAVGAALLARAKTRERKQRTKFRGFSIKDVAYRLNEFTCKACSNYCHMQEFTVENEKTYWGDQCSDKFRRRQVGEKKPVIENLLSFRRDLYFGMYDPNAEGKATIGLPRGMYLYEHFPFWNVFFRSLGYRIILSDETNRHIIREGNENSVAEPCLPIQAYHGHVQQLLEKGVDWIFIPNMINAETPFMNKNSYYCPWGQTIPFVIKGSASFAHLEDKIINPPLRFRDGRKSVFNTLYQALRRFKESKKSIRYALEAAYRRFYEIQNSLIYTGKIALEKIEKKGEIGIVLVGRTYNIYDRGLTLDIGNKLRDYYGVNVIPIDFLATDSLDITDVHDNMYWNYGRKIIAAAKFIAKYPNLHLIFLTNFKCGPDSFIKHYITKASGKPFLSLQFDGHGNDAGYLTRCEAYLDSKGVLRNYDSNHV